MTKTPEELAKLTDEELAAEMRRVGDGVEDATAVIQEALNRRRNIGGPQGMTWRTTRPLVYREP